MAVLGLYDIRWYLRVNYLPLLKASVMACTYGLLPPLIESIVNGLHWKPTIVSLQVCQHPLDAGEKNAVTCGSGV